MPATAPALDPADVGDVVWGNANAAGEDNVELEVVPQGTLAERMRAAAPR
ncbi:hypothetical protein [Streptomyces brasiliensis]|uniref:Uncharacterized protein n=1 Tax=Streptomyces brasiliensis TaxID=1954 RepID=A0A917L4F9_9ACTN|nr:hypothetical protein [Streptomyces brasiliensis]GGJ44177.1 hypothetical protein GCM10010121_064240 [Streptomyces brasiliensis]